MSSIKGWALKGEYDTFLFIGNPNREYDNLRMGCLSFDGWIGALPALYRTKREASDVAKTWNSLVNRSIKGHIGHDGRPIPCISESEKVKPVKIEVTIKEVEK